LGHPADAEALLSAHAARLDLTEPVHNDLNKKIKLTKWSTQ
jgi:hypothetical protein